MKRVMGKGLLKFAGSIVAIFSLSMSVHGQDSNNRKNKGVVSVVAIASKEDKGEVNEQVLSKQKSAFNYKADYILRSDDEIFVKRNGELSPVKLERIIGSIKVNAEGRVLKKNGSESLLKAGDVMTLEGDVVMLNENEFLKERIRMNYKELASLEQSNWGMQDDLFMITYKSSMLNRKMDLVNQKMMIVLDFMNMPKNTRKDLMEYIENISALDEAIIDVELKIREVDELMKGSSQK